MEEQILFEGKLPFRVIHFSHSWRWLLLLGWNLGLLMSWLQTFQQKIKLTSQRIVLSQGLLTQDLEEVEFYRVKDIIYHQSLIQRMGGIGTIMLFSTDTTAPTISVTLPKAHQYREQIRCGVNAERQRLGIMTIA